MSYSQQPTLWLPDLHGQMCGHSVLMLVANNELKDALTHIVDGHQRVIHGRYDVMAGTTGTLEVVQKRFPTKQFIDLGHGPEFGDIWAIVFMLEQLARAPLGSPRAVRPRYREASALQAGLVPVTAEGQCGMVPYTSICGSFFPCH